MKLGKSIAVLVVAGIIGAVAWWLGSPLFIDEVVDEALPEVVVDTKDDKKDEQQEEVVDENSNKAMEVMIDTLSKQMEEGEMKEEFMKEMKEIMMEEHVMGEEMESEDTTPTVVASGAFQSVAHEGSGEVLVYEAWPEKGKALVRFENLDVLNGPDLRVLLSPHDSVQSASDLGEYVELGKLKGNKGDQNYEFDLGELVDTSNYKSVVIYCKPFKVVFASAPLQRVK